MGTRVDRQLSFLIEADKLKKVERRSILMDGSRNENSAEHSWHVRWRRWRWPSTPVSRWM